MSCFCTSWKKGSWPLGRIQVSNGKRDAKGAMASLETAARLKPDEAYVHYQLGRAYLAAGRKGEGESQLEIFKQLKDKVRNEPRQ